MLISWFAPGTRAHGVSYAAGFGVTDDPRRPHVIDGDPELFDHHARHSPYAQSHIAYALCFDRHVAHDEALAVHERMLDAMMPARVEGAVMTLGIQHTEPGPLGRRDRTAVHAFVSCRDLFRGRFFQPAFRAESQYRIELAQELINQSAPYRSPKDPEHAQSIRLTTRPRAAGRSKILGQIRSAVIGGEMRSAESVQKLLGDFDVTDVVIDGNRPNRLSASFSFVADDGERTRARLTIRPGQVEKLMRGSSLRHLLGDRYVRSPQVFERMRTEFLAQIAIAASKWSKKHDTDIERLEQVCEWARGLPFAPFMKSPQMGEEELLGRMPIIRPPKISGRMDSEADFTLRPLSPPIIEGLNGPGRCVKPRQPSHLLPE